MLRSFREIVVENITGWEMKDQLSISVDVFDDAALHHESRGSELFR